MKEKLWRDIDSSMLHVNEGDYQCNHQLSISLVCRNYHALRPNNLSACSWQSTDSLAFHSLVWCLLASDSSDCRLPVGYVSHNHMSLSCDSYKTRHVIVNLQLHNSRNRFLLSITSPSFYHSCRMAGRNEQLERITHLALLYERNGQMWLLDDSLQAMDTRQSRVDHLSNECLSLGIVHV